MEFSILFILVPIILLALIILLVIIARIAYLRVTVDEVLKDKVVLQIKVPVENDKTPLAAEQLFQSLHGILRNNSKSQQHYSFEIVATSSGIYFIAVCAKRYKSFLENQIYAQYPQAQIREVSDYAQAQDLPNTVFEVTELGLAREHYLPIKTFNNFSVDPLASITGAISNIEPGYEIWIQLVTRPVDNSWQRAGKSNVDYMKNREDAEGKKVALQSGEQSELSEIERKNTKVGFQFVIRILVKGPDAFVAAHALEDAEASFKQFQTGQWNSLAKKSSQKGIGAMIRKIFLGKRLEGKVDVVTKYKYRLLDEKTTDIVNTEEMASLFHLPDQSVETPNIVWSKSKKLEPPKNIPVADVNSFAYTDFRNVHIPFGLKDIDRRRHMYILGKTGSGKSNLLKTMIVGDIHAGKGLAVVDPHGDLVEEVLAHIPQHRIDDVVYLDPSDMANPIGLNMLDLKEAETLELLGDGIVSVFKKYFDSWGPRLQYILTNVVLTLLHCQNVSLLAVQRLLVDQNYRRFLLKQVKDPFLIQFWEKEYADMAKNPRLLTEAIAPIQNKVGRFLNSPLVRNMVGQIKSNVNLDEIMNEGKIFLVNLSQGKIGEENSSLLGGMIVTRLYTNAMQRAKIPEKDRRDFYLYVDEFQNFATDTFVKILSEARKYGLNLVVTHQYIDQISPELQTAIFGNVGTMMNFVVGQQDANRLQREYSPYLDADDLVNLDRFRLAIKMMIDGAQTTPFTAMTVKAEFQDLGLKEMIKNASREKYSTPREIIEEKLQKWSTQEYNSEGNLITNQTRHKQESQKKEKALNNKNKQSKHEHKVQTESSNERKVTNNRVNEP